MPNEALRTLRDLLSERRARIAAARSIDEVRQITEPANISIPPGVSVQDVDADGVPAAWVSANDADSTGAILYLHGGGYVFGSIRSRYDIASRLARETGLPVLVIGYRLAPEHPFPAALDDARASYDWLVKTGFNPGRIVVIGDSAGGGLAAALLTTVRDTSMRQPAAGVLLSPWVDLTCDSDSMTRLAEMDPIVERERLLEWAGYYATGHDPRHPRISPLRADLSELPPLLIQVGSDERLLDDATRFDERAKAAGVDTTLEIWDHMVHNWQIFASMLPDELNLPERGASIRQIARFVDARVSGQASR